MTYEARATELLESAYVSLGFSECEDDTLLAACAEPGSISEEKWVENGDWLALAQAVGADKVFFVGNNPVVVFAHYDSHDLTVLREFYNRIWCMARPRLLFLARPGELAVYDLASEPPRSGKEPRGIEPLAVVNSVQEVSDKLHSFRREELESGRLFAEERFGGPDNRADKALIRDLKVVRQGLIKRGLCRDKLKYAHAIIGRSIFIRYLEDRGILRREYFEDVARPNPVWSALLRERLPTEDEAHDGTEVPLFPRILRSKQLTYAIFRRLATDFNGDMFPDIAQEEAAVAQEHLDLIRDLMYGDVDAQRSLFFYAYRFNVVPIELISSIYEEFYHEEADSKRGQGAFYTPPALVEFILSQVLTSKRLSARPRIVDPACGSGIFLVESFRRIVRHRVWEEGRPLRFDELEAILRDQLGGIDVSPEATRVAAFSLYLALLHYLEPPDILEQIERGNRRLPNLVTGEGAKNPRSFDILLAANAFDADVIDSTPGLKSRFSSSCADIVVGNPPWGAPGPGEAKARQGNDVALKWCKRPPGLPVGDRERSQAFIWRSLDLLKPNGVCALLVSTGIFFKHQRKTVEFRRRWLAQCSLRLVFDFSHTRTVFFRDSVSPFAAVIFDKTESGGQAQGVQYWSAKRTGLVEGLQAVFFCRNDLKILRPDSDLSDYRTWKVYLWGGYRDERLIRYISENTLLAVLTGPGCYGRGFEKTGDKNAPDWLADYRELPVKKFTRYGNVSLDWLVAVPETVHRMGKRELYEGTRILVKRGITQKCNPKGQLIARLETQRYCFRNSVHGFKLKKSEDKGWRYKILIGILWSSLARYYFFVTSSTWGRWHDEIHLKDELLHLPIRFPENTTLRDRIVAIVDRLSLYSAEEPTLFEAGFPKNKPEPCNPRSLERQLDEAIYELYGLDEAEIDLIRDMCDVNLDYYYSAEESAAAKPLELRGAGCGTARSLPTDPFGNYLRVFLQSWATYLEEGTELHWQVHMPPQSSSMLAVVFTLHDLNEAPDADMNDAARTWADLLRQLDRNLVMPLSPQIYIEGLVRAVTDESIIIIKKNAMRFWTKSMAREDAEATLVQAMNRQYLETNQPE